jgi:hypothetical protein
MILAEILTEIAQKVKCFCLLEGERMRWAVKYYIVLKAL